MYAWRSLPRQKSPVPHSIIPTHANQSGDVQLKRATVHLKELFVSHARQFLEKGIGLYGKKETVRYYCIDLLWGQKLYQELRFALVEMNGIQGILASTSLALDPLFIR